jgi:uncharacterized protein (TIGR02594 family)
MPEADYVIDLSQAKTSERSQKTTAFNLIALVRAGPLGKAIPPLYLHDFVHGHGRKGVQVERRFFDRLRAFAQISGQGELLLRVKYALLAPWMDTALKELGQHETAGKKANPRILQYFKASGFWGTDDTGGKNAWCGSFVSWVMRQHGHLPPKDAFRAKEWSRFGRKLDRPVYGAIGVKSRQGGGHVAFVLGQSPDGKHYYMLGGNQSDEVNISKYAADAWDAFVVPGDYVPPEATLPVYDKAAKSAGTES